MSVDPYRLDLERSEGEGMMSHQPPSAEEPEEAVPLLQTLSRRLAELVREHPLLAVGIAAGAAYLLGRLSAFRA